MSGDYPEVPQFVPLGWDIIAFFAAPHETLTSANCIVAVFIRLTRSRPAIPLVKAAGSPVRGRQVVRSYRFQSGQTLVSQNVHERVEPASLTKLMTAYVVFSSLYQKRITLTQAVASVRARMARRRDHACSSSPASCNG